jgi:transposase
MGRLPKNHRKDWTKEQEEILEDNYGKRDLEWIAKKVGRTQFATRKHITKKLKLDPQSNYYQLSEIATQMQVPRSTIYNWANKEGLPHKKIKLSYERERYFADMEEVWKWLQEHPRKWNAARLEENILGYEPAWVKEKRKQDWAIINDGKYWKKEEKERAWNMWALGYSYKEMAEYFKRTESSTITMLDYYRAAKAGKPFNYQPKKKKIIIDKKEVVC